MTTPATWPAAVRISVAGLLTAAVGLVVQFVALPELFPTVPPGPIVLAAAAGVVALGARWWWSPLPGLAVAVAILVGGLLSDNRGDTLTAVVPAVGAAVMLLGLTAAVAGGVLAITRRAAS